MKVGKVFRGRFKIFIRFFYLLLAHFHQCSLVIKTKAKCCHWKEWHMLFSPPLQYLVLLTGTSGYWNRNYSELQILHQGHTWHLLFSCSHAKGLFQSCLKSRSQQQGVQPEFGLGPIIAPGWQGQRESRKEIELFYKDWDLSGRECWCLSETSALLEGSQAQGSAHMSCSVAVWLSLMKWCLS